MTKSGQRLIAAAKEARGIARGEIEPARMYIPADIDVRAIRRAVGLTQDDFAAEFGFSVTQIRDWEQGRSRPLDAARAYLMMIEHQPKIIRRLLSEIKRKSVTASEEDAA
jgi:putative transcriptional regulator